VLEVGDRAAGDDTAHYPEIDLVATRTAAGEALLTHKDGRSY
jgi:uncharacterized cupin superfamily protein